MIISDYDLELGQEVAWNMSYIEQESAEVNQKYLETIKRSEDLKEKMKDNTK